jgi:hypothetical protein
VFLNSALGLRPLWYRVIWLEVVWLESDLGKLRRWLPGFKSLFSRYGLYEIGFATGSEADLPPGFELDCLRAGDVAWETELLLNFESCRCRPSARRCDRPLRASAQGSCKARPLGAHHRGHCGRKMAGGVYCRRIPHLGNRADDVPTVSPIVKQ